MRARSEEVLPTKSRRVMEARIHERKARREKQEASRPARERGPVTSNQFAKFVADSKSSSVQEGGGSEVFKSLFTTHKSAQNKPKGHWVTFDPRYNC